MIGTKIVSFVVIALIAVGVIGYVVYDNFIKRDTRPPTATYTVNELFTAREQDPDNFKQNIEGSRIRIIGRAVVDDDGIFLPRKTFGTDTVVLRGLTFQWRRATIWTGKEVHAVCTVGRKVLFTLHLNYCDLE